MVLHSYLQSDKNKIKLLMLAIVSALLLPLLMLLAMSPVVRADGNGSPDACLNTTESVLGSQGGSDNSGSEDTVTVDVGAGNVVTGVCIKSGENMFNGNKHSGVLANGTYEDGCYTVTGVGAQSVTVTRNFETNECQGISHIDVVYTEANEEAPVGALQVNKVLLNASGAVTGDNTEANTLGFRWGFQGSAISSMMGTTVNELEPKSYEVTENVLEGYSFAGYYLGEGSCSQTEADKTLPISVTVQEDLTTMVTLCNIATTQVTGGGGGQVLGESTTVTTAIQPQVLGASTQVAAPIGGVSAGGASGSITGSLIGLGTSLSALGFGAVNLLKKEN